MTLCQSCGHNNDGGQFCGKCGSQMGKPAKADPLTTTHQQPGYKPPATTGMPVMQPGSHLTMPPQRSYFKWFAGSLGLVMLGMVSFIMAIISILADMNDLGYNNRIPATFNIGMLLIMAGVIVQYVYVFLNFSDFQKLHRSTHSNFPITPTEPIVGLLLYIFISPIGIYFKYNQLYAHLTEAHQNERDLPPSPLMVLGVILGPIFLYVFSIFLLFSGYTAISLILGIIMVIAPFIFIFFEYKWQRVMNSHISNHQSFLSN